MTRRSPRPAGHATDREVGVGVAVLEAGSEEVSEALTFVTDGEVLPNDEIWLGRPHRP